MIETVRQWSLSHPPFSQPKYMDAAINAVEVAYAVADPEKEPYTVVGNKALQKCLEENPQPDNVIKSEK